LPRSLIEELQLEACDRSVSVAGLLRKALLVASRLEIPETPEWIDKELSGYASGSEVPTYRMIRGRVVAQNPMRGWQPVMFPTSELESKFGERPVHDSMATLEEFARGEDDLFFNYPAEAEVILRKAIGHAFPVSCSITRASLVAVIDEVRNKVLRWSMELAKAGISGDGLSFTPEEKQAAHNIVITNTGNLNLGVVGSVTHSNVAAGPTAAAGGGISSEALGQLVSELSKYLPGLSLPSAEQHTVDAALTELQQAESHEQPEPGKIRSALGGILGVVAEEGRSVVTAGIKAYIEGWMRQHGLL
jgi:hypothetical protein